MHCTESNPGRYYQMIRNYREAQLLFAAIRLNIFSHLDTPVTAQNVAEALNCGIRQTELLLLALDSSGLIVRLDDFYVNTSDTKMFLSQNSVAYLGESLLFREKMTSLDTLKVKLSGDAPSNNAGYDFATLAKVTIAEMYAMRVEPFITEMKKLFSDLQQPLNILDLGGGAGVLSVEFAKHFPNSKATVFEIPPVADIAKDFIQQHSAQENVRIVVGDFNTDSLGGPYDLIIASGIFNFVVGDLSHFFQKLSASLCAGGYLLITGQFAERDGEAPPNMIGWLSGFLDGTPLPPSERAISQAIKQAGLSTANTLKDALFKGHLYRKDNAKPVINPDDIVQSFIELTEQTANSKINILNFGSEDMTFYRGEIHMIKMIGDFPGIYSAELARKFGITRPVVHKTLQKLAERELITKEDDTQDKKRQRLYLTEKGWTAYRCHEEYHDENDRKLFDFLADMPGDRLAVVKDFLDHAISLIHNHA